MAEHSQDLETPLALAAPPVHGWTTPAPAEILERAQGENFPVALRWLGRRRRRHLGAVYGFARLVDWIGDEAPGDRTAQLDALEADLERAFLGRPRHPLLRALVPSLRELALPADPFLRLIEANRRDQEKTRYATFDELLDYCRLSANPVGELVLYIFEAHTPERLALSDAICTGLQLAEHWQDVAEDRDDGRIYLPAEDLARFSCRESDLAGTTAPPHVRALMRFQVQRARDWLARGGALVGRLSGAARLAVAGYRGGGEAALDAIARADYDVLRGTPRTRRRDVLRRALGAWVRGR
ncbi:MAG: squalene synthase HpnC [Proteobacteria bacterium]|nr:squalene synthase HpnC [Pseudomonadota bacterium]